MDPPMARFLLAAVAVGALAVLTARYTYRAVKQWRTSRVSRRVAACVRAGFPLVLLVICVVGMSISMSMVRTGNALRLQLRLALSSRFSDVGIRYLELKQDLLRVDGSVESEDDIKTLRTMIASYNWHGLGPVYWEVRIMSTGSKYEVREHLDE